MRSTRLPARSPICARLPACAARTTGRTRRRPMASFERIYWIAGGRPKEASLDPLLPWLARVRRAYLIGEAAAPFEAALSARVACTRSGDLASAVAQAAAAARA